MGGKATMASMALTWSVAAIAALVAAVSVVRAVTGSGETRFAAGGDLLMGVCMAAMALPATAGWYAGYGMVWAVAFALLGIGGVVLAVKSARQHGWSHGRRWSHLVMGSAGMVIMTLAMTPTSSGPVLALGGSSMTGMQGMQGMAGMQGMGHAAGAEDSMHGTAAGHGMSMPGMSAAGASTPSSVAWRLVIAALAGYFLLSIAASVWVRVRGGGRKDLTGSMSGRAGLAAHIGMGGAMSAMLLMMAA
jgi:hypothetical protein